MTTVHENSASNIPPEQPLHAPAPLPANKTTLATRLAVLAALLLAGAASAYAFYLQQRLGQFELQMAQNIALLGGQTRDLGAQHRASNAQNQQAQAKMLQLETRIADLDAQRVRTDTALQTLVSASETALLTELRASLQAAQQQAQLSGNAQPLLAALADADKRLSAAHQPRQIGRASCRERV